MGFNSPEATSVRRSSVRALRSRALVVSPHAPLPADVVSPRPVVRQLNTALIAQCTNSSQPLGIPEGGRHHEPVHHHRRCARVRAALPTRTPRAGPARGAAPPGPGVALRPDRPARRVARPVPAGGHDLRRGPGQGDGHGRWSVGDPVAFVEQSTDPLGTVYLAAQVALRDALAGTSVESLSARGAALPVDQITGATAAVAARVGVEVAEVVVKDVILPAEVRHAAAELVTARHRGAAQLEAARAETAALRSLANGAKLLDATPRWPSCAWCSRSRSARSSCCGWARPIRGALRDEACDGRPVGRDHRGQGPRDPSPRSDRRGVTAGGRSSVRRARARAAAGAPPARRRRR